jgi:hypothetical protein
MAIGRVTPHHVRDHAEAERVRARKQAIKIFQRSEYGIDGPIVGHVIAEIPHRRGEERRNPDGVHAQACDIVELLGDPGEIAHAVTVAVAKAAGIDMVDGGALAPSVRHAHRPRAQS